MNLPTVLQTFSTRWVQYACGVLLLFVSLPNWAVEKTYGYFAAGTINGVSFAANGTLAQQTSPTTNADVFCAMQGNNMRLPLMAEMNIAYLNKPPMTGNASTTNGAYTLRRPGSLVSEWGANLSLYLGSGWVVDQYNVQEPFDTGRRSSIKIVVDSGVIVASQPTFLLSVACVRSL